MTHPLDAIARTPAVPPGKAVLLDENGRFSEIIDYPDDVRLRPAKRRPGEASATESKVFGNWCRRERERAGMTQEALADAVGCHFTLVSRIENGRGMPGKATMAKIRAVLGPPPGGSDD